MSPIRSVFVLLALVGLLSGCAKPPQQQASIATQSLPPQQVAAVPEQPMPPALGGSATADALLVGEALLKTYGDDSIVTGAIDQQKLAGRSLQIGAMTDLKKLKPGEVILTFDDGPDPSITPKILATLQDFGVKATFFMVGKMAKAHPETAQLVALAGHSIGSHSHGHENLKAISYEAAINSVDTGDDEIAAAIKPTGKKLAPFFRFPYLNETRALRADLTDSGFVIFDVDVDSWDYLQQSPEQIIKRTLRRLDAKGGGVILFHDIHARTAKLLPDFLGELAGRGYKVVRAIPKNRLTFDLQTLIASR